MQALNSGLSSEYSGGFDEFIMRPCHLCAVTHTAVVGQDYPGGRRMWVSLRFPDPEKSRAVAVPPGVRFEIAARRPYCIKVIVRCARVCVCVLAAGMEQKKNLNAFQTSFWLHFQETDSQAASVWPGLFIIQQRGSG